MEHLQAAVPFNILLKVIHNCLPAVTLQFSAVLILSLKRLRNECHSFLLAEAYMNISPIVKGGCNGLAGDNLAVCAGEVKSLRTVAGLHPGEEFTAGAKIALGIACLPVVRCVVPV